MAKNGNQPATKKELRQEIRKLEQKMDTRFRAQNKALGLRIDSAVERAEERLHQHFDKVLTKLDPLIGEIHAAEGERSAIAIRLSNHEDRIQNLEAAVAVDKTQSTGAK